MSLAIADEPSVLHMVPGRLRLHLPGWAGQGRRSIEAGLRRMQGVRSVQANALTSNILVQFDPAVTNGAAILEALRTLDLDTTITRDQEPSSPPVHKEKQGQVVRARIAVRGLDRDPHLAKRVIEHLEGRGVRANANLLTGRVLVEFLEYEADLEDLLAEIERLELPELPGEDRPAHPLDLGPLVQSMTRAIGATFGLGVLAARKLIASQEPLPGSGVAIHISSIIGILYGIPFIRYGLRSLLGRTAADLLISIPSIITLTLAGSPLGLALTEAESLRLLTEVNARQAAWRRHEEHVSNAPSAQPDAIIRLGSTERTPLRALVLEGTGTATGRDGMPLPVFPGGTVPPGGRVYGGPFVLKLQGHESFHPFIPLPRPAPLAPTLYDRYLRVVGPTSLVYTAGAALLTRSFSQTLAALLFVNPRTATIGQDMADLGASARVLRAGITVVGTRKERSIRLPDLLLLDGARLLTDGLELTSAIPLSEDYDSGELLAQAAGVAAVAGSPWGGVFTTTKMLPATEGSFDGKTATAYAQGVGYSLGPIEDWSSIPEAARLRQRGHYVLVLRSEHEERPLGIFALRPLLAAGLQELVQTCRRYGVELAMLSSGDQLAVQAIVRRANVALIDNDDAVSVIRAKQQEGGLVAFVSDNAGAAAGFDACDLAIGLADGRTRLQARADLLAPDLSAIAAIVETAARRDATVRDSVGLSAISNIIGAVWGIRGLPGLEVASRTIYISALSAIADGWLRLRGGERPGSTLSHLVDPRPERWGRRSVENVLRVLHASENGLTSTQAAQRLRQPMPHARHSRLLAAVLEQFRSPLLGILAAGAGLSLLLGSVGDVVIITATIAATVAVNVWQEYRANRVVETLERMGTSLARVLRDGQSVMVPTHEVVPGDVLLLAAGDRVAADARIISAQGLEADEAALTGESLPVPKAPDERTDASRVVLAGSDITTGTGRAIVVAVGRQTRMGATSAALSADGMAQSPLGVRLSRMLRVVLPVSLLGGAAVVAAGLLWGQPLMSLVATGATIALAGVPEGLPLLAKIGEAGVARRLASRNALVRRLSAVEALGRVDVACADKTGTMTKGHLALSLVTDDDHEASLPGVLPPDLRHVLLTAALASPHPDAPDAQAHPTDVAVIRGALDADLQQELQVQHEAESSFDPVRSFHATLVQGRLCIKGAPEALLPRCHWVLRHGQRYSLDPDGQRDLLAHSQRLAGRGLRVLMVAEGSTDMPLDNPQGLTALGFVGISDPLRSTVRSAVQRCREAGVRVIMITGDHPATARTIALEAGLLDKDGEILTGTELAELRNGELDEHLEHVAVIARATPLDKLRIVESLQRLGHTVAMTGDGVNDAPSLRLAEVGVAMGHTGTEVARQTADVVLADDDFSTLVESFVEGRSFWRNIRRALGLLLGGNLGELCLVVGASLLGLNTPLTTRQILAMNAITDILPALAIALQQPEHRNLAGLVREGTSALDKPLRNDIMLRATLSAGPSLATYLVMLGSSMLPEARSVAYASIVANQLAQTLDAGWSDGTLTRSVLGAVAGSAGVLLATLTVPPLRSFLNLVTPGPLGWTLIGAGALVSVILHRLLTSVGSMHPALPPLLASPSMKLSPA